MAPGHSERRSYTIDSDRLKWPLEQQTGVPGLPEGVAVLPTARSHVAVLRMMCGSGKTFVTRRDLHRLGVGLDDLIVAVMCGQLFTRATGADWEQVYGRENVYVYLDGKGKGQEARTERQRLKEMCKRGHGVVFISIESFMELDKETLPETASIGALLLEETCELVAKMLGETCPSPLPFRRLKEVAARAERIICPDADWEADGVQDGRCLRLTRYLCPNLPVHVFGLRHKTELMTRTYDLYLDSSSAEVGRDFEGGWEKLKTWMKRWRSTGRAEGNRVAVACSTKTVVKKVCELAMTLGLHWCDYTSDTDDETKNAELSDPSTFWVEVGLVAFTQTLGHGADPKHIEFAAVFMHMHGTAGMRVSKHVPGQPPVWA